MLASQPDPARWTLPRFLEDVCARHGPRVALRFEGADFTYDVLAAQARGAARGLLAGGLAKGARVAVAMGNRPEWVFAAFGVALAGGVVVPLNTLASPAETDHVLRHSDASVLLMQRRLGSRDFLAELAERHPTLDDGSPGILRDPSLPFLRRVVCLGLGEHRGAVEPWGDFTWAGAGFPESVLDAASALVTPTDDGVLLYSSGTTAHPKGILHFQRAPVIQSWRFAELMDLATEDRVFTAQPFFWTAGFSMSMGATLAAGARLVLQELFAPGPALALVESERVTILHAFPHQEKALAEHPGADARDLRSVTKLRFDSPLASRCGVTEDAWSMHSSYGLTETFTLATAYPARAAAALRRGNSGPPLDGTEVKIVHPETGTRLAPGEEGEIAVRGLTLMRGYHRVPPERVFDDEGFFHTQDGGFLDATGVLHWTGRLSGLIKTGGANVSPVEVENALAEHPELKVGLVVGVPHPTLGEIVVLCALAPSAGPSDEAGLRAFLRQRLAAYKVPRRVLFFREDELTFTGNRKLQPAALRDTAVRRLEAERATIEGHRYGGE